jgi:hypothetical protein
MTWCCMLKFSRKKSTHLHTCPHIYRHNTNRKDAYA